MTDSRIGAAVVVGGGIGGAQSALDLADSGFKVYLVEKSPSIGGCMAQLDKTFPTNDCSTCILSPKLVIAGRHPNIELLTNAELTSVEGEAGNFQVAVTRKARYVNEEKCTGCGTCAEKCPVRVPSEFDMGLGKRRAIYIPFPQAVPLKFGIDKDNCLYFKLGRCKICSKICPAEAIDYDRPAEETLKLEVGSIILAPGANTFDPTVITEYGYGRCQNVMTSLEFERILSASGPTRGHVERPSDGKTPRSIAFIQCVGSRDEKRGAGYCSSVCCMYAMKEAIIALEHNPNLRIEIFFMDARAFGKEFEDFYLRARNDNRITFTRCRVAEIVEDSNTQDLKLRFIEDEASEVMEREFDLVVLSVGITPPKDAEQLSSILGIKLNKYGFAHNEEFSTVQTTKSNIFVAGCFSSPKNIQDTVAEASAAAAKASAVISSARGSLSKEKHYPPEMDVSGQEPRIGVFVCHCGGNIGRIVDVAAVVDEARKLPNVVFAEDNLYSCSYDTLERIKTAIKEQNLNRVVVAACSHRTHEPLFQETVREAGLNLYLFELANIRDQCSWVHMHEPEKATSKAKDLMRMAVAKSRLNRPLSRAALSVNKSALVLGGGLSGITAALELAGQGFHVHLVEREDTLGGNLRKLHYSSIGKDPHEYMKSIVTQIAQNEDVTVHTKCELTSVEGYVGNFSVKIINEDEEERDLKVGTIVVATGGRELEPQEYLYGSNGNVLTQLEFDDRLASKNAKANCIVMIQCVGSRDQDRSYCSRVCCSHAMRNAIEFLKQNPSASVYILYKDIRTYGFNEDLYREAAEKGVVFIRYTDDNKPKVENEDGLTVTVKDPVLDEPIQMRPDLLILSTAILPQEDNGYLAKMLKVPLSKDGFFLEAHMKLRPVDFATDGVFLCGLAHSPQSIEECMAQASAAAQRASMVLCKNTLETEGIAAFVNEELCIGCRACDICSYNAMEMTERRVSLKEFVYYTRKAHVNEALCKGCGKCASVCQSGAIEMRHFSDRQLVSQVLAALEVA